MSEQRKLPGRWFALDNAAKIFPGQNSARWSNAFRVKITLTEKINPLVLDEALGHVIRRFPCFDVKLRRGFFWYYFESNKNTAPPVLPDIGNPCHRFKYNENLGFLFRVYYYENDIAVDFFHSLTDGYGATTFLCTLAAEYLRLTGKKISVGGFVLDINQPASESELRDPFLYYCDSKVKADRPKMNVYHFKGEQMPRHTVNMTTGLMPVESIHSAAKQLGLTITEYISAMLVYVHYKIQLESETRQKDISAQIPVNLRRAFESNTLRNFSMCYCYRMNPNLGEYTFEEIARQLSLYLRFVNNKKNLNSMMAANTSLEKNPLMRGIPLAIKKAGMFISFAVTGERSTSAMFTNLGRVTLPPDMDGYVRKFMLMPGPGLLNGARVGGISYSDTFAVTFANRFRDTTVERLFFRELVSRGIHVKIESNMT